MLYDWDLTWYQLTSYTIETADYKDGNIAISYPQLVNVHNSYTEEEWNDIFEQYAKKDLEYLDGETSEYTLTYEVATATEDLLSMPVLTDVDGGQWRPVNEEALQEAVTLLKEKGNE